MSASLAATASPVPPSFRRLLYKPVLLIIPTLLLLCLFFVLPYLNMVVMSFREPSTTAVFGEGYTIENYRQALTDTYYLGVLLKTILLGVGVSVVCLILAYPVAFHLARSDTKWKGLLYACVLSPLLVGVVVRCYGWIILLANKGLINQLLVKTHLFDSGVKLMYNLFGVGIGLVHVFLPFMILPLISAIQSINPALEEAARSLGASRTRTFLRILLPLSLPGIQSGVILVFMLTISAYVIPILLGAFAVKIMPTITIQLLVDAFLWPFGAALALILSVTGALCVVAFIRMSDRFMKGIM